MSTEQPSYLPPDDEKIEICSNKWHGTDHARIKGSQNVKGRQPARFCG